MWTDWRHQRWALAAAAVLILALSPLVRDRLATPEPDALRGGGLVALPPVGELTEVKEFLWHADFEADSFLVEVFDVNNAVIHSATTREKSVPPSTELRERLRPGRYTWRVTARDRSGATLLVAPPQAFTIRR